MLPSFLAGVEARDGIRFLSITENSEKSSTRPVGGNITDHVVAAATFVIVVLVVVVATSYSTPARDMSGEGVARQCGRVGNVGKCS